MEYMIVFWLWAGWTLVKLSKYVRLTGEYLLSAGGYCVRRAEALVNKRRTP